MPGLRKLIVVDSFAASRIRELRLDGHVHVSGRNGRGKTTLIRLIPLFYGEQPSRIVRSAGSVVRSLREFMFGRSTSYVAFEYENHDGIKLAILHFGADHSPRYHLADGAYAREIFVDDGRLIEGGHLNARLRVLGRQPSGALGVLQYRAVVQGNREHAGAAELRPLVRRFALVAGRSRLAGIERISSGMFSKDITFAALKRMAAAVACDDDEGGKEHEIVLALSRRELEGFLPDFKAYRAVMALEPEFVAAGSARVQASVARHQRAEAAERLRALVRALGRLLQQARTREASAEDELAALKREERDAAAGFDREAAALAEKRETLGAEIARAETEEKAWAARGIDALIDLVARRPALEAEARRLKARQGTLLEAADSVSRKYQALFAAEEARRDQAEIEAERRFNTSTGLLNQEIAELNEERQATLTRLASEHEDEQSVASEAWQAAMAAVGEVDRQRADSTPDPELAARAARAEAASRDSETARQRARAEEAARLLELTQREHAVDQHQPTLLRLGQQHHQAEEKQARLLLLESPAPGTLLHFLRGQCPGWHEDIAKVLREDLLLRDDLDPARADDEDAAASLYGLMLHLSRIDSGRAADEALLAAEIARAKAAVDEAKAALAAAQQQRLVLQRELERAREVHRDAVATSLRATGDAETARQAAAAASRERETELAERRRGLDAQRDAAASLARSRQATLGELKAQHRRRRDEVDAGFSARRGAVETRRSALRQRHDAEIKQLKAERRASLAGLEDLRRGELSAAGVDTNALKVLEDQLKAAEREVATAARAAPVVEEYRRWQVAVPPARDRNRAQLLDLQAQSEALARQRRETLDHYAARIEHRRRALETARQATRLARQRLEDAEQAQQSRLIGIELGDEPEAASSPDNAQAGVHDALPEILSTLDAAGRRLIEHEAALRQHLATLVRTFHRPEFAATKVGEFGAHLTVDYGAQAAATLDTLADWYNTAHAQQRDVLAGALRNGCGILKRFQGGLISFQSRITGLSRELQASLDADMVFEAIRRIALRLSALVERRPYWGPLSRLLDEYARWEEAGFAELPPPALLDELQDFARHLPDGPLAENPETLMDLDIEVDDGTEVKRVRTESDLKQVSSNGLSYLVLCLVFVAFANRARRAPESADLWLTWALDEIGTIDEGNSRALLAMLNRNRIRLVSASPEAKAALRALFDHRYEVLPEFEIRRLLGPGETAPEILEPADEC